MITIIGVIVPRRLRRDWRQEWEAELRYRELLLADWDRLDWRRKLDLLWRSTSAFWDALWLQQLRWEDEMIQDLRFGSRMLLKNPGFTLIAVFTLTLGIGANTAIFSVVNAVLLRPLPYQDADRLMKVSELQRSEVQDSSVSPGTFVDWKKQNTVFERLEAVTVEDVNLIGTGNPERLVGMRVTTGFFSMLGTPPQHGRDFLPEEESPGRGNVAILSNALWRRQFGANPDVLNKTIRLNDQIFTVVGVMPSNSGLRFRDTDIWMPLPLTAEQSHQRAVRSLYPFGRLKADATVEGAQSEVSTISDRLASQYPEFNGGWTARVTPLLEYATGEVKSALLLMFAAAAFVLLITCTNVANLQLARAASRQKEIAIRSALGAGRVRIVRQLLTESVILSVAGGIMGSALALGSMRILLALAPDWYKPRVLDVSLDGRMLVFTTAIAMLTGIIFGLIPALHAANPRVTQVLKDGRSSTDGRRQQVLRNTLIVLEIAMSLVLLVGAGLVIKSFIRLQKVDPGFNPNNALSVSLSLPEKKYPERDQQALFYARLLERVATLPGVEAAGASSTVPFSDAHFGIPGGSFKIEGKPPYEPSHEPGAVFFSVSPDYFNAMGIVLLRGRPFRKGSTTDGPRVAIINDTMARTFFSGEDPIGKRIHIDNGGTDGPEVYCEIVGVVGDVKHSLDQETNWPQIYEPCAQRPSPFMTLVVRAVGDPKGLNGAIREEVLRLDREQPVFSITMLEQLISESTERQRFSVLLFGVFAAVALVLAAVGLYGVMSYTVSRRINEIGIRMALGARRQDVLSMILRQGIRLTVTGIALGLLAAWMVTRLLTALLFGVSTTDPLTFAGVSVLLVCIAALACYLPARRATKVDPMTALRHE